jgi:N utilization substance protein B
MAARTKARKRAIDILFEADQRGANLSDVLAERIALSGRETPVPQYGIDIVRGVIDNWVSLNVLISEASDEWTIDRMPAVDRAVLRIAAWEIIYNDEIPTAVAIDEAMELVSDLSTDDSAKFVGGVLGRIAREADSGA